MERLVRVRIGRAGRELVRRVVRAYGFEMQHMIFRVGTVMPVAPFTSGDAVIVCEGGTECRLYLAERLQPNGARHVFLSGLDVASDTPEGAFLLDSILGVTGCAVRK